MSTISKDDFHKILRDYLSLNKIITSSLTEEKHLDTCMSSIEAFKKKHYSNKGTDYWLWQNAIVDGFTSDLLHTISEKHRRITNGAEDAVIPLSVPGQKETHNSGSVQSNSSSTDTIKSPEIRST